MDQSYLEYYQAQSGRGLPFNEPDFGGLIRSPKLLQRGRGLGGVFANLFRYIKPLLYSGLSYFKDQALDAGAQFLSGKPANEILKEKGLEAVDKLREKASEKIKKMTGSGRKRKSTTPLKRLENSIKRNAVVRNLHSHSALKANKSEKEIFNDIFNNGNLHA